MKKESIVFYEELSMNAYPALRTQLLDGWILRFSNGYTNRANCVCPLYESNLPFDEKVKYCEKAYKKQELPIAFKLTDASTDGLDEYLGAKGYEIAKPTFLYSRKSLPQAVVKPYIQIKRAIDAAWCYDYFRLNGMTDPNKTATATAMLNNVQNDVICAYIERGNEVVACGLCVVERGFAGLHDIIVDASCRGHGYGFDLCNALLAEAARLRAKEAYLQVVASNIPAIALYKKLGFEYSYQFWYRVKNLKSAKRDNT